MATHKIKADLDVDGEVQGTSLDINGDGNISGQLGINTAPAAGVELHVNGEIRVDGTDGVATRMIRSSYFSSGSDIEVRSGSSGDIILGDGTARLTLASNDTATFAGTIGSGAITSSGNVTLAGIVLDGNTITGVDDSGEFTDNDAHIMTSAGINDRFAQINANTTGSSGSCTGTAAQANNLQAFDDRDMAPEDLSYSDDLKLFFSAREGLEDGTSTGSDWHDVLVLNSYSDSSGGNANILAFDKSAYTIRHYQAGLSASNWGTAKTLAYTDSDITGNAATATTAGTVTTAAQTNITSLGTLTTLTVDNVIINGTNIGHTSDTDLITLTSGKVDVAGELECSSLDVDGNADIAGNLDMVNHTLTANNVTADSLNLKDGGDFITFYGGDETNHSISSRDAAGSVSDDLRINSYGALYINLDSNNNNSSGADFVIGRHGSATSTIVQDLLTLSGENGKLTINGEVEATSLDINGNADISGTLNVSSNLSTNHVLAAADSSYNVGSSSVRYANGYFDTVHGDGSNLTNISATDSTKLPLAGGTMTGNITFGSGLDILMADNAGAALEFKQGSDLYLRFITTNSSEKIEVNKNLTLATGSGLGFSLDSNTISGIDDSGEFTNDDNHIMTSAAIEDKILGYGYSTTTGTVTGTGVDNRIAIWNGTGAIDSDSDFYVDGDTIFTTNLEATTTITCNALTVAAGITHAGDTNNKIAFTTDTQTFSCDGNESLIIRGNAVEDEPLFEINGAGAGNQLNIGLLLKGVTDGNPIKMKMQAPNNSSSVTGAGILSYEPDADTFNIGQSTTHNSMAISINNSDQATFTNAATLSGGFVLDGNTITGVDNASEFTDDDNHIMTSTAIKNKIADNDNSFMLVSTTTTQTGTKTFSGVIDITNTTDSSNATGDTGALRCEGGGSIAKKLYVGSTITGSADVIAFSDKKLKENIQTLDGKKVLDMRGVSFTRKDTGAESSGVIAQEIQKVAPELVHDTEGTLGVAYGNLVGYLIEAVKDQQKQINELKEIINGSSR